MIYRKVLPFGGQVGLIPNGPAHTQIYIYIVQLVLRNIELWVGFTDAIDFHKRSKDIAQRNYWDVTVGRGSS